MTGLGIMVGGFIKGLNGKTIEKGDLVQSKTYQKHGKDHFAAFAALGSDYRGRIAIAEED